MGNRLEERKKFWTKKKLLIAALILCVCVMVAALVYIGYWAVQYFHQRGIEDNLVGLRDQIKQNNPFPSPSPYQELVPSPTEDGGADPTGEPSPSVEPEWYERNHLLGLEQMGLEYYAEILAINPHYRGHLIIPGLGVDTPYVHTDDNDYYLYRSFYGEKNAAGTVFLSCYNDRLLLDKNNVLFGHNMNNGTMFAPITKYKNADTYKKAPIINLDGLTGETTWIVFASYVSEPDYGYTETDLTDTDFEELLAEIKARSLFVTDVDVNEDDRILTLSTCSYEFEGARFVVHARQLRKGEEAPSEVAAVKNAEQKSYNIPNQMKLSDIKASKTAILQHPNSLKLYYYQIKDGGIEWFVGNTSIVQGIYTNFTGKVAADTYLSAVFSAEEKRTYLAMDRYNKKPGIYLLYNRLPSGDMYITRSPVTPANVDAKYPLLVFDGTETFLLYTVSLDTGEEIYRLKIENYAAVDEPELLFVTPAGSGTRALGYYTVDGNALLLWHETETKTVLGTWLGFADIFDVSLSGNADRLTFYGSVSGGKVKVMTEKDGKFTASSLTLTALPSPVPIIDEIPQEPEQSLEPAESEQPVDEPPP